MKAVWQISKEELNRIYGGYAGQKPLPIHKKYGWTFKVTPAAAVFPGGMHMYQPIGLTATWYRGTWMVSLYFVFFAVGFGWTAKD